ncbi:MAG TPA: hypothetical protein VFC19_44630 [Candidatus Limnocylindrales bacterium]|nr:hypothetical protein [Candidatus Limnocylindrales bacterium]
MIEALVEEDRWAHKPAGPRKSIPQTRGGVVPAGGHDFVRLAMAETGCSEAVAVTAVRLIVRRRRPQLGQLRAYLARFSRADRLYWVDRARWVDPATAIGELAAGWGLSRSEAGEAAAAGHARALAARAFAQAERERVGGLRLLDAELARLSASSPAAASVIAAVSRDLEAIIGGGDDADGAATPLHLHPERHGADQAGPQVHRTDAAPREPPNL